MSNVGDIGTEGQAHCYWGDLPDETCLDIIFFVPPWVANALSLTSKRLRVLSLDQRLWKAFCDGLSLTIKVPEGFDYRTCYLENANLLKNVRVMQYVEQVPSCQTNQRSLRLCSAKDISVLSTHNLEAIDVMEIYTPATDKTQTLTRGCREETRQTFEEMKTAWELLNKAIDTHSTENADLQLLWKDTSIQSPMSTLLSHVDTIGFLSISIELDKLKKIESISQLEKWIVQVDEIIAMHETCIHDNIRGLFRFASSQNHIAVSCSNNFFVEVWERDGSNRIFTFYSPNLIDAMHFFGPLLFVYASNQDHPYLTTENTINVVSKEIFIEICGYRRRLKKCSERVLAATEYRDVLYLKDVKNNKWVTNQLPDVLPGHVCFNEEHNKITIVSTNEMGSHLLRIYGVDEHLNVIYDTNGRKSPEPLITYLLEDDMQDVQSIEWKHGFIWLSTCNEYSSDSKTTRNLYRLDVDLANRKITYAGKPVFSTQGRGQFHSWFGDKLVLSGHTFFRVLNFSAKAQEIEAYRQSKGREPLVVQEEYEDLSDVDTVSIHSASDDSDGNETD